MLYIRLLTVFLCKTTFNRTLKKQDKPVLPTSGGDRGVGNIFPTDKYNAFLENRNL